MNKDIRVEYRASNERITRLAYNGNEIIMYEDFFPWEFHWLPDNIIDAFGIVLQQD